jgi:hypothetical protein
MSQSTTIKIEPLTTSTYNTDAIKYGKPVKNQDYGFVKYHLTYEDSENNTGSSDNIIRISNLTVKNVYPPQAESKNPKYTVRFIVSDDDEEFCNKMNKYVLDYAFENREEIFGDDEYEMEDLEANYTPLFKKGSNGETLLSVSFPFNNPKIKNPVRIAYKEEDIDPEILRSVDLIQKLGVGSTCTIFLHLTNLYKDDTDKFKFQSTIFKRINVETYANNPVQSGGNGAFKLAPSITEINTDDVVMGNVVTNDKQGRSLKPRIKYTTSDGEEKTKNINVGLKGRFRFTRMTNEQDGKVKVSFSVVYTPTDEEVEHFNGLNTYMYDDLLKNYGKYEKGKKITKKNLTNQFRGTVKKREDDEVTQYSMWFTVYAKELEDGSYDFCGNFMKMDGTTKYTNEQIENDIFGKEHVGEMNIYFKHIWFGKYYSCKFNMGSVKLDLDKVEYDLGDETYFDGQPDESSSPVSPKNESQDADLDATDAPTNSDDEEDSEPSSDEEDEDED